MRTYWTSGNSFKSSLCSETFAMFIHISMIRTKCQIQNLGKVCNFNDHIVRHPSHTPWNCFPSSILQGLKEEGWCSSKLCFWRNSGMSNYTMEHYELLCYYLCIPFLIISTFPLNVLVSTSFSSIFGKKILFICITFKYRYFIFDTTVLKAKGEFFI